MVKTKKGKQRIKATGQKRAPSPSPKRRSERTKTNAPKTTEIDVTTIADDNPRRYARKTINDFSALQSNDSSSDESSTNSHGDTPRKGEDKKRQRFATETEVIEVEKDNSIGSSIQALPNPVRLIDTMDTDSDSSRHKVTIADILGQGPEETIRMQQPLVINKDCRFNCQIKVTACDDPIRV